MASVDEIMQVKSPYKSSPIKETLSTGPARTAYDHVFSFLTNIEDWNHLHKRGLVVLKSIQYLNMHEYILDEIPKNLKELSDSLCDAGKAMEVIIEEMDSKSKSMKALAKLCISKDPLINTWSAGKLSSELDLLCELFKKEMELKQSVIENVCHCRNECLTEVYISSWEYDVFVDRTIISLLRAELQIEDEPCNLTKGLKSP